MRYRPFSHLGLKLISVGLAMLLWLSVARDEVVERGLRIPLELQNLPASLELVDPPPETVDVRVRGPSAALGRLAPGDLVAVLDLITAKPGQRLVPLPVERVRVPFDVQVIQLSPSTIPIRFEPSVTASLPVVPSAEGLPAPGFIVGKIASEPATVQVVGAESQLSRVTEAVTESVSIEDATVTVRKSVPIGVANSGVRLATPQSALVTVEILPAPVELVLQRVPVHLRNGAPGLALRSMPPVVQVRVRGSKAALARLQADSVTAYVDVAGLGPGQYGLPVRTEPAKDFGIESVEPASVQIQIQ